MLFTGSYTALLTPFKNGEVDYDAYRKLVDFQIDNGTHGLVPVGTTENLQLYLMMNIKKL